MNRFLLFASVLLVSAFAPVVRAEEVKSEEPPAVAAPEMPTPYDEKLLRMSEILGSVHYLRNLCKGGEDEWRNLMAQLLAEDTKNEPQRAARLTAAFNRGYRAFASTYVKCTPQARAAEAQYRAEGATLAAEIAARFGN
jgi:uncharacterized protein (TIGR02301 family)